MKRTPKFRVGQVVCVYKRHFVKIVEINKGGLQPVYFMSGFLSAFAEDKLRALTKREQGAA